jgi:cyclohexa-1,5-dienecarbonyl-CoA hydratase
VTPQLIAILPEEGGSLLRIRLCRPPGNILDLEMVAALRAAVERRAPAVKTILLEGEGDHFSFGASVAEHRPAQVRALLPAFHELFRELVDSGKVLLAAVRGQCLGGGLELVLACHRVFASPESKLGNPELKLGVFAPLASALLPWRVGQSRADDLLLTGRIVPAREALAMNLVDEVVDDPAAAAIAWHRKYLAPGSTSSLAYAVRAARLHYRQEVGAVLEILEKQYLEELVQTADAREGIEAFLEKRAPKWTNC